MKDHKVLWRRLDGSGYEACRLDYLVVCDASGPA
jgi:hypothetical protein